MGYTQHSIIYNTATDVVLCVITVGVWPADIPLLQRCQDSMVDGELLCCEGGHQCRKLSVRHHRHLVVMGTQCICVAYITYVTTVECRPGIRVIFLLLLESFMVFIYYVKNPVIFKFIDFA